LFFLVFIYFFHPIPLQGTNVDLGHHLLLGKITVEENSVPQTNLISFTHPEYVFVNNQWLSEVVFHSIYEHSGFNGLIFLAVTLMIASFVLLYFLTKEKISSGIIGIFLLQIFIDRTEVKPELFSYFFIALFLFTVYRYKKKFTKLIFLLPPIMSLWINFHIFFIIGISMIGLFYLERFFSSKERFGKTSNILLGVLLSSILATLINPNFIKGVIYPFHVLTNYGFDVIENYNIFEAISKGYFDITFLYFFLALIFLWVSIAMYFKKLSRIDFLLSCLFTFLAIFAIRNFTLFAIGVFIPVVSISNLWVKTIDRKFKKSASEIKCILGVIIILLAVPGLLVKISIHGVGVGVVDKANSAIAFIKANDLRGPIYNNYNIGNYLEYTLYPRERVFVDGNPEQYPQEFFKNIYYPMENSFDKFQEYSKKYNINVVVYEHKNQTRNINPLLTGLTNSPEWRMVYLNELVVVYVKNIPRNSKALSHQITEDSIQIPKSELTNKDKIADLSNFFRIIKWYKPMVAMDLAYLDLDPRSCTSLRHIMTFIPAYVQQYQLYCK